jgi:hypothetical protein
MLLLLGLTLGCTNTEPDDSAPDDTSESDADTDTDTDTDTDADTDSVCPEAKVTYTPENGGVQDLTDAFMTGQYVTLAQPGTVEVCPGTWFSRVLLRADIEVIGLGTTPEQTVMSGGESGTIIDVSGPDVSVAVRNVTLDRGAGLDVDHNSGGGGVYCEQQGVVEITDARFTNNFANDGSGLYARNCDITVRNTNFTDNLSEDDGGAFTLWASTATLESVRMERNTSLDGGAMALFESTLSASNLVVADNTASNFGGGIWANDATISLVDAEILRNTNDGSDYGGGLIIHGTASMQRVTFTDNTAPLGGGLFVYYGATVNGTDITFNGNAPEDVYVAGSSTSHTVGDTVTFTCFDDACDL